MPPRLLHKKSRTGCRRCKTRKVKCDEVRPICGACRRHNLDCEYIDQAPPTTRRDADSDAPARKRQSTSQNNHAPSPTTVTLSDVSTPGTLWSGTTLDRDAPTTPRTPSSTVRTVTRLENDDGTYPLTEERRLLELRLMHRYMQSFSDIFAGIHNVHVAEIWRDLVPALAIRHPFLLHAMYTVTTLHAIVTKEHAVQDRLLPSTRVLPPIPSLIPSAPPVNDALDLNEMKRARRLYLDLGVRGHRLAVSNLNKDNADAVCMATILISNQGFLLDHDLELHETGYVPPVQWMLLAASITTVMAACKDMVGPESAMERIKASGRSLNLDLYKSRDNSAFFKPLIDFQPNTEPADLRSYQSAVNLLGAIRDGVEACEPLSLLSRRFFSFPSVLEASFIGLVRQHRPRALVMMACFFAMTKAIEGIWWFRGAAARHVEGLRTLIPRDWSWALDWIDDMAYTEDPHKRQWVLQREHMCAAPILR